VKKRSFRVSPLVDEALVKKSAVVDAVEAKKLDAVALRAVKLVVEAVIAAKRVAVALTRLVEVAKRFVVEAFVAIKSLIVALLIVVVARDEVPVTVNLPFTV
jgi:hypothetical protein